MILCIQGSSRSQTHRMGWRADEEFYTEIEIVGSNYCLMSQTGHLTMIMVEYFMLCIFGIKLKKKTKLYLGKLRERRGLSIRMALHLT